MSPFFNFLLLNSVRVIDKNFKVNHNVAMIKPSQTEM